MMNKKLANTILLLSMTIFTISSPFKALGNKNICSELLEGGNDIKIVADSLEHLPPDLLRILKSTIVLQLRYLLVNRDPTHDFLNLISDTIKFFPELKPEIQDLIRDYFDKSTKVEFTNGVFDSVGEDYLTTILSGKEIPLNNLEPKELRSVRDFFEHYSFGDIYTRYLVSAKSSLPGLQKIKQDLEDREALAPNLIGFHKDSSPSLRLNDGSDNRATREYIYQMRDYSLAAVELGLEELSRTGIALLLQYREYGPSLEVALKLKDDVLVFNIAKIILSEVFNHNSSKSRVTANMNLALSALAFVKGDQGNIAKSLLREISTVLMRTKEEMWQELDRVYNWSVAALLLSAPELKIRNTSPPSKRITSGINIGKLIVNNLSESDFSQIEKYLSRNNIIDYPLYVVLARSGLKRKIVLSWIKNISREDLDRYGANIAIFKLAAAIGDIDLGYNRLHDIMTNTSLSKAQTFEFLRALNSTDNVSVRSLLGTFLKWCDVRGKSLPVAAVQLYEESFPDKYLVEFSPEYDFSIEPELNYSYFQPYLLWGKKLAQSISRSRSHNQEDQYFTPEEIHLLKTPSEFRSYISGLYAKEKYREAINLIIARSGFEQIKLSVH